MAITYTQSNKVLDFLFGNTDLVPPTNYYIGLSTTPISANGSGITEPSGGGYERISVANNKTNFTTSANGYLNNAVQLEFPESTSDWGTITHIFIADQSTSGNVLYYDTLTTPRQVQTQTSLIFVPNSIQIQLS